MGTHPFTWMYGSVPWLTPTTLILSPLGHLLNSSGQRNSNTEEMHSTLTTSSKDIISEKWCEIHGSNDWDGLLNTIHPWLRREIVKYGEFTQATYNAFDFNSFSNYCRSCRYNKNKLFDVLGLDKNGYNVSKYIYAMSHIDMPQWLERSHLADTWSKHSNWMRYVAVSNEEEIRRIGRDEIRRIGKKDIVVAWRGTVMPSEWYEDMQRKLEPIGSGDAKVEHRLHRIYTAKSETTRVGNNAFKEELHQMGVKTLRVVVKQDMVPKMPGLVLNESLQMFDDITGTLDWVYTHIGAELKFEVGSSPYLKRGGFNLQGFHSL
ncbi:phospholipase A1-Igamma1, chloroplastic-like [Malus domestica]|uniref:phospholipase A1-Igamma1, chloroplastic-like n=1 Tax=Malus domestica TaxID=3750 RepID=UPI003975AEF2